MSNQKAVGGMCSCGAPLPRAQNSDRGSKHEFSGTFMGDLVVKPQDLGIGRLFSNVRDAVIVAEASTGRIVLWNAAAAEIFGYSASEALEMNVEALVPERLKAQHRAGLSRYRDTGHGRYVDSHELLELPAVRKGGEEISIEMSLSPIEPIREIGLEESFVLAIIRNVTQRKRMEKKLRESETKYRTLVEEISAVAYIQELADPESNRTSPTMYASPQIETQSGYPPRAFVEDPELWIKLLHPEDRERVLAEDARTDETGEPFKVEYRQISRDGRITWLRDEARLVRDEEGNPSYWLGVQVDITELKRAEEALQEANRRLEELAALRADFTAMVAHEIGTPLATIRGFLEMMATGELEPAERDDALATIRAEVGRLSTLVADVRSAAAIEQGKFGLMFHPTPVGELIDDAVRFAETLPGDHPLAVDMVADGRVRADAYRVGQVLRNLLSNAAKYSPDGAAIELRTASGETPGRIRIEVIDRGRGVHPEDVDLIFEKFGRGRDRSGQKQYGVGLGLYLSRRIVRDHGGELRLDATPGGGSTFSFELEAAR